MNVFATVNAELQRRRDKRTLESSIMQLARKAFCVEDEFAALSQRFGALNLTLESIRMVRARAYAAAAQTVFAKGSCSREDQERLNRIKQFLAVPDAISSIFRGRLDRLALVTQIRSGHLSSIETSQLLLTKGEIAYWSERARLLEERVVDRRYVGGSQGFSVKVSKRVTYRVGLQRGQLISRRALVPISNGLLWLTNKRVIFIGDAKSFSVQLDRIVNFRCDLAGFQCIEHNGKCHNVRFASKQNHDIVSAVLTHAIGERKFTEQLG